MTHTDETGRLFIVQPDGTEIPVYASLNGGYLAVMTRAIDEDTFNQVALQVGLVVYSNPEIPATYDDEGNELTPLVPASGPLVPAQGVTLTHIGPYVITQGTYDDDGVQIMAPVIDPRFHVNFWLSPEIVARGTWETWIIQWMAGTPGSPNADEISVANLGIELIDPLSIKTPANVLL